MNFIGLQGSSVSPPVYPVCRGRGFPSVFPVLLVGPNSSGVFPGYLMVPGCPVLRQFSQASFVSPPVRYGWWVRRRFAPLASSVSPVVGPFLLGGGGGDLQAGLLPCPRGKVLGSFGPPGCCVWGTSALWARSEPNRSCPWGFQLLGRLLKAIFGNSTLQPSSRCST